MAGVRRPFSDIEQAGAAEAAAPSQGLHETALLSPSPPPSTGRLEDPTWRFPSVSSDTRTVGADPAVRRPAGERFDATIFSTRPSRPGPPLSLVADHKAVPANVPAVVVADTASPSAAWPPPGARFHPPVVAVTGSNGKTTTKGNDRRHPQGPVRRCRAGHRGNLNNDIGLPLTPVGLRAARRAAVIE